MDHVASFCADMFAVVSCCQEVVDGYAFQHLVRHVAGRQPGSMYIEGPGLKQMFGRRGVSGLGHELDTAVQFATWVAIIESKSLRVGPSKNDVLIFDGKTLDLYVDRVLNSRRGPHFRFLVSRTPIPGGVAGFALLRGIICISPERLPLPLLLAEISAAPKQLFSESQKEEAREVFSDACRPMEDLWAVRGGEMRTSIRRFRRGASQHAVHLHEELSVRLMHHPDSRDPTWANRRARWLVSRLDVTPREAAA